MIFLRMKESPERGGQKMLVVDPPLLAGNRPEYLKSPLAFPPPWPSLPETQNWFDSLVKGKTHSPPKIVSQTLRDLNILW